MPRMDGEEAFRAMCQIRSDVRAILSSGYREQEIVERLSGLGVAGFLQKPYQLPRLLKKVREVLQIA